MDVRVWSLEEWRAARRSQSFVDPRLAHWLAENLARPTPHGTESCVLLTLVDDHAVAAGIVEFRAEGWSLLHLPSDRIDDGTTALLHRAAALCDGRQTAFTCLLTEDVAGPAMYRLHAAGYRRVTEVLSYRYEFVPEWEPMAPVAELDVQPLASGVDPDTVETLMAATLSRSEDCPELAPLLSCRQRLDGYGRTAGYDPELSRLFLYQGRPCGLCLADDLPDEGTVDLFYLGLAPEVRGRGWGRTIVSLMLSAARARERSVVELVTDIRNRPAIRSYAAVGFREVGRRELWVRQLGVR